MPADFTQVVARLDELNAFSRGDVFLVPGDEAVTKSLMHQYESGALEVYQTHTGRLELASTLVLWLVALPEPLIPTSLFKRCSRLAQQKDAKPAEYSDIVNSLPARNADVLRQLVSLLRAAISAAENDPAFTQARITVATQALARDLAPAIVQSRSNASSVEFVIQLVHRLPLSPSHSRAKEKRTGLSSNADVHDSSAEVLSVSKTDHDQNDERRGARPVDDTIQPTPSLGFPSDLPELPAAHHQGLAPEGTTYATDSIEQPVQERPIATTHGCVCARSSTSPRSGTHFEGCGWPHFGWCDVEPGCSRAYEKSEQYAGWDTCLTQFDGDALDAAKRGSSAAMEVKDTVDGAQTRNDLESVSTAEAAAKALAQAQAQAQARADVHAAHEQVDRDALDAAERGSSAAMDNDDTNHGVQTQNHQESVSTAEAAAKALAQAQAQAQAQARADVHAAHEQVDRDALDAAERGSSAAMDNDDTNHGVQTQNHQESVSTAEAAARALALAQARADAQAAHEREKINAVSDATEVPAGRKQVEQKSATAQAAAQALAAAQARAAQEQEEQEGRAKAAAAEAKAARQVDEQKRAEA
eukprot:COSAG02_NODE_6950_length_3267_cov_11.394571_2_plen_586_part_01